MIKALRFFAKIVLTTVAVLLILIMLFVGIFYIENFMIDDAMMPVRDSNEIFSDMHFQDSVLQNTSNGEYFLMVKKYVEFMIVNGRDRYGKDHSPLFATTLDRQTGKRLQQ